MKKLIIVIGILSVAMFVIITQSDKKDVQSKKDETILQTEEKDTGDKEQTTKDTASEEETCYRAFIDKIQSVIEDDFTSISTDDLEISDIFNRGIETNIYTLGYYFRDLDEDGVKELLLGANEKYQSQNPIYGIYTYKNEKVVCVASGGEGNVYYLCKDGTIANNRYFGNLDAHDAYYSYKDGQLSLIEAVICNGQKDENQPFYLNIEDVSLEKASPISNEKALGIIDSYEYDLVCFLPFTYDAKPSEQPKKEYADKDNLTFSELEGMEFMFSSGAGAWRTVVSMEADGSFTGHYIDSDAGEVRDSYPKGTRYECCFSGQFSGLMKTGFYEYTMKCTSLNIEGTVGEEKIVDDVKIITANPYGFDDAYEFKLYLPGKASSELPEGFLAWSHDFANEGVLDCYGLYNVSGEQGFVVWDTSDKSKEE